MINALRMLREDLREKARWCYESEAPAAMLKTLASDGTSAMILYRLMQGSREARLVPLELVFNKLNAIVNECVIGRGTEFGPGFVIIHANGIVINGEVRGGAKVRLEHQVTIGNAGHGSSPVLGNDIYVGAGAKVIGSIAVGDGAKVGANAVVVHDVAPETTVVGIPAKPVKKRDAATQKASASNGN